MVEITYDKGFEILEGIDTGQVRRHFLVDINANDYREIQEIAREKALMGMQVDIMPTLGDIEDPLRRIIFPDAPFAKSPDLRINGTLWEVEPPTKPLKQNNLSHAIGAGASQAHHVIISLMLN